MKIAGRFAVEFSVLPHHAVHGAQADRLAAMLAGDEVIKARIEELAAKMTAPRRKE